MRPNPQPGLRQPQLLEKAQQLDAYLKTLSAGELGKAMHLSGALAQKTHALIADWNTAPEKQSLALDCFVGDIYSGLRANSLLADDRDYADKTLFILSGLYGAIRPYDGVCPYRLEMGYRFPGAAFTNLYQYWGDAIAKCLPSDGAIVNVTSEEFMRTITPFVDPARIVTPRFFTVNPKTGEPVFVVVHAKIARGAFARWLVTTRTTKVSDFKNFDDLGYVHSPTLSTVDSPAFVCDTFLGKGLSMKTG